MIELICNHLKDNKIGIIEHDTLPGIVALASAENALKIQRIKHRPESKGFIILIPCKNHLNQFVANVSKTATELIDNHWPGPLTLIFKKHPNVPEAITGNRSTIAIRYPKHPILNQILSTLNHPLLSTSANISGTSTLPDELLAAVDFTFGNIKPNKLSSASTIADTTQSQLSILRQGDIKLT